MPNLGFLEEAVGQEVVSTAQGGSSELIYQPE